ncbi:hypothetical protein AWT69_002513 [Pseudomonas putida]|nr:hypothetical protein AWT69_002513 [Pseudomonas putida]
MANRPNTNNLVLAQATLVVDYPEVAHLHIARLRSEDIAQ